MKQKRDLICPIYALPRPKNAVSLSLLAVARGIGGAAAVREFSKTKRFVLPLQAEHDCIASTPISTKRVILWVKFQNE